MQFTIDIPDELFRMANPLPSSRVAVGKTGTGPEQGEAQSGGAAPGTAAANVSETGGGVSAGPAEQNVTSNGSGATASDIMDGGPAPGSVPK